MSEEASGEIKGFIKDLSLVQETSRVEDLLDFSESIAALKARIGSIGRPSIVGLVGKFGSGKSTMLYQLEKNSPDYEKWIIFDAWKYPERQGLWEGFVLDFADQVGLKKEALKKIAGKDTVSSGLGLAGAVSKEFAAIIPGIGLIESVLKAFESPPAKRVFELQAILQHIIQVYDKHIIVVVEDIDRSGDAGIYFLETLKDFIKRLKTKKKIVVIVPIGDKEYVEHDDSYLKCLDYTESFKPKNVELEKFVEAVFNAQLFEDELRHSSRRAIWTGAHKKGQITTFLEALFYQLLATPRLLKKILRQAELTFQHQIRDGHDPDWRVTICLEAARHFPVSNTTEGSVFNAMWRKRVVRKNTVFGSFLFAMIQDRPTIYIADAEDDIKKLMISDLDFEFITRKSATSHPSWPWHFRGSVRDLPDRFLLCDFYLDY